MFENYKFRKEDFEAIEESIEIAYGEKMRNVFRCGLGNVDLASYDSKFIYLWSKRNYPKLEKIKESVCRFKVYRFPHKLNLVDSDYDRMSWACGGIKIGGIIFKDLPSSCNIHCAPVTARIKFWRKQYKIPISEVVAEKAHYRAIIAHEFGHYYFSQNITHSLLKQLSKLSNPSIKISDAKLIELLEPPDLNSLNELFASLVELETLKVFYPKFVKKEIKGMNLYAQKILNQGMLRRKTDLISDGAVYAKILAPRILESLSNWPKKLHELLLQNY